MNILITGATGFLGQSLVLDLLEELKEKFKESGSTIYCLTRNVNFDQFSHLTNVKLIKADITQLNFIEESDLHKEIIERVDWVIHAAALYDLSANHRDCYLQNVVGTQNILRLVKKIKNLKAFYYISTIAVGDESTYFLEENELPNRKFFSSFYSETKYLSEKLVRDSKDKIPVTRIIRPGIIIADTKTQKMPKVDGPYYITRAFNKYSFLLKSIAFLPLSHNPNTKIPLIPVDHCSLLIAKLIKREDFTPVLKTYHLISNEIPTIKEFLNDLNIHFNLKTKYIPVPKNSLSNVFLKSLGIPKEVIPFMFSKLSYEKTRTLAELPEIKESVYSQFKNCLWGEIN